MSAAVAAAAAAACYSSSSKSNSRTQNHNSVLSLPLTHAPVVLPCFSRYEAEKRRDWNTFMQYLNNQRPPLALSRCSGAHVLEFLKYLDEFGKTKVHGQTCPFFGVSNGPTPCSCPLRQSWGSLDGIIGRLRVAFEENGGRPETNPFSCPALMVYLRQVRDEQAKPRGMGYEKKKSKINPQNIYG